MSAPHEPRVTVKVVDMENDAARYAQDLSRDLILAGNATHKAMAAHLKRKFDDRYGRTWHAIVGNSFGSYVTHRHNNFIYFFIEDMAILLFKSA
ncbi:dynein light chain LC8-type [Aphelenchoides avenae]|nr:dynein light chain LC8-type [Aphelenchus avenae]